MLKSKEGKVTGEGTEEEILADYVTITKALKESISREKTEYAFKLGIASDRERKSIMKDTIKEKLEKLAQDLEMDEDDKDEIDELLEKLTNRIERKYEDD